MTHDVAIIGAGPAGLMAAETAARQGLKVALIEKRNDIGRITRACCQQFIMDDNFQGESIRLENGTVVFPSNGFSVPYSGKTRNVTDKYYVSPSGNRIHFAYDDKRPIVIKFDKGLLLKGILERCMSCGIAFRSGTVVSRAEDTPSGVTLHLSCKGTKDVLQAKKLIIAEGVNAGVTGSLGLNKDRMLFATALCVIFYFEGMEGFVPTELNSFMGAAYRSGAPLIMGPSLEGPDRGYLVTIGNRQRKPEQIFGDVVSNSPLAPRFQNARVVKKLACAALAYSSLKTPCSGNVLVIGDAAAYVEVETQGALTCGFQAGNAVAAELSGKSGFADYTTWWQQSFEFNGDDYLRVAQGFALVPTYTDDELDFLFSLIEDRVLEGTFNQYKSPRLMWDAILQNSDRIKREHPDLYTKIHEKKLSLSDVL